MLTKNKSKKRLNNLYLSISDTDENQVPKATFREHLEGLSYNGKTALSRVRENCANNSTDSENYLALVPASSLKGIFTI